MATATKDETKVPTASLLDAVAAKAEDMRHETRWYGFEDRLFGPESSTCLRVEVHIAGEAWRAAWGEANTRYRRKLSKAQRRNFDEGAQNVHVYPNEALIRATRYCISQSKCIVRVARWDGTSPLQDEPDGDAVVANSDVFAAKGLLSYPEFVMGVSRARLRLEEEGQDEEDEAAKN